MSNAAVEVQRDGEVQVFEPGSAMESYRDDFRERAGADASPSWLKSRRAHAMDRFLALGFPTMRDEDWHFTNVAPLADQVFRVPHDIPPVGRDDLARFAPEGTAWNTIVFVNGVLSEDLSSWDSAGRGVRVRSLDRALRESPEIAEGRLSRIADVERNAFTALNTAFFRDGVVIDLERDAETAAPIHILHLSSDADGVVSHPRVLINAGRQARATVVETFATLDGSANFTNAVAEIFLAEGARVEHYKLQREGVRSFHVGTTQVHQSRDSEYYSFSFATGARLSRTNIYTVLDGEAATCTLNGLYMVDGDQHVDHQTAIEHVKPHCPSHEVYKGILDGRSHGVFNGKVYVHPEAQKTDGKQSNNNLLLSEHARVDTKPQLEIFADDVKCTHGATVGRLDEVALFYMKSRGIGADTARQLLTYAFAADVLEMIPLEPLRESLEAAVLRRFTEGKAL